MITLCKSFIMSQRRGTFFKILDYQEFLTLQFTDFNNS